MGNNINVWLTYGIIAVILVIAELVYFKIADHFNIIDKPNERSSHSTIVLRAGGIIFSISILVWTVRQMVLGKLGHGAGVFAVYYRPSAHLRNQFLG